MQELIAFYESLDLSPEDWELILTTPDAAVDAPQFHTYMSPFAHDSSLFAQVTWNYRELPSMLAGGLQVQGWNGENFLTKKSIGTNKLSTGAETVTSGKGEGEGD